MASYLELATEVVLEPTAPFTSYLGTCVAFTGVTSPCVTRFLSSVEKPDIEDVMGSCACSAQMSPFTSLPFSFFICLNQSISQV